MRVENPIDHFRDVTSQFGVCLNYWRTHFLNSSQLWSHSSHLVDANASMGKVFLPIEVDAHDLTSETLLSLFKEKVPYILIRGILSHEACREITERVNESFTKSIPVPYLNVSIKSYGYSAALSNDSPDRYFRRVTKMSGQYRRMASESNYPLPIDSIKQKLRGCCSGGVENAVEADGKEFFPSLFQRLGVIPIHDDKVERLLHGFNSWNGTEQLWSCIAWLDVPTPGFIATIWDQSYSEDDRIYRNGQGNVGLKPEVIRTDTTRFTVTPEIGNLLIFNTRYLHSFDGPTLNAQDAPLYSASMANVRTVEGGIRLELWT